MANTFKSSTFASPLAADTWQTLYTAPASTTTMVLGINIANASSGTIKVDLQVQKDSGDDPYIVYEMVIPAGSSFAFDSKYVLQESDVLRYRCDVANASQTIVSYMEIS
jgi:hypothetical protein